MAFASPFLGEPEKAGSVGAPLIGGPFILADVNGKQFSDKDLHGKYYLLYFGFTHCPDICPEELTKISEIVNRIHSDRPNVPIIPVFITCDPERDSPDVLKTYLRDFHSEFVGLTGSPQDVKNVAKSFRVYYRKTDTSNDDDYLIDHSIFFYLMGPDGNFLNNFGRDIGTEACVAAIVSEMDKGSKK